MTGPRRAALAVCWLGIAALLIRIAVGGAISTVLQRPSPAGALASIVGAALVGLGIAIAGALILGAGAARIARVSIVGGVVAIGAGLILVVASHESGSLIALLGLAGLLVAGPTATARRP